MDNRQAIGYMLLACKKLGYTKDQVRELYREMYFEFDFKTEEEAEKIGHEWYVSLEDEVPENLGVRKANLPVASKTTHLTEASKSKMRKEVEKSNEKLLKMIRRGE